MGDERPMTLTEMDAIIEGKLLVFPEPDRGKEDDPMTDHERGCEGRSYTCTCGYDAERDAALTALREECERLKREVDIWRAKSGGIAVQPVLDSLANAEARATAAETEAATLRAALASARNEALEEVARYHDDAVMQIRHDPGSYKDGRMRPSAKRASNIHEASAAAIRKLKEKAE